MILYTISILCWTAVVIILILLGVGLLEANFELVLTWLACLMLAVGAMLEADSVSD